MGAFPRGLSEVPRAKFHEWAGHSIVYSVWARSYYQRLRSRGKGHHAAIRALAFKWIRVVFRCWKDGVAYDESKYLASLARRGSPLAAIIATGKRCELNVDIQWRSKTKCENQLDSLTQTSGKRLTRHLGTSGVSRKYIN